MRDRRREDEGMSFIEALTPPQMVIQSSCDWALESLARSRIMCHSLHFSSLFKKKYFPRAVPRSFPLFFSPLSPTSVSYSLYSLPLSPPYSSCHLSLSPDAFRRSFRLSLEAILLRFSPSLPSCIPPASPLITPFPYHSPSLLPLPRPRPS